MVNKVIIPTGKTLVLTLDFKDGNGNFIPAPVFDSHPIWSHENTDQFWHVADDWMSVQIDTHVVGSELVTMTVVIDGVTYTQTTDIEITEPHPFGAVRIHTSISDTLSG